MTIDQIRKMLQDGGVIVRRSVVVATTVTLVDRNGGEEDITVGDLRWLKKQKQIKKCNSTTRDVKACGSTLHLREEKYQITMEGMVSIEGSSI